MIMRHEIGDQRRRRNKKKWIKDRRAGSTSRREDCRCWICGRKSREQSELVELFFLLLKDFVSGDSHERWKMGFLSQRQHEHGMGKVVFRQEKESRKTWQRQNSRK